MRTFQVSPPNGFQHILFVATLSTLDSANVVPMGSLVSSVLSFGVYVNGLNAMAGAGGGGGGGSGSGIGSTATAAAAAAPPATDAGSANTGGGGRVGGSCGELAKESNVSSMSESDKSKSDSTTRLLPGGD